MSDPEVPAELDTEWKEEEARHIRAFVKAATRWPNYRMHLAYALLGGAIAIVDSFGGDVEGFVQKLRIRHGKVPPEDVILPPRSH
jgi:hypothetical protein